MRREPCALFRCQDCVDIALEFCFSSSEAYSDVGALCKNRLDFVTALFRFDRLSRLTENCAECFAVCFGGLLERLDERAYLCFLGVGQPELIGETVDEAILICLSIVPACDRERG